MRIISVNVNGIQAAVERGLLSWLQAQNADVICLQDTRASAFELDDPAFQLDGYFLYACDAEVPAQGGVALYSRLQPKAVNSGASVASTFIVARCTLPSRSSTSRTGATASNLRASWRQNAHGWTKSSAIWAMSMPCVKSVAKVTSTAGGRITNRPRCSTWAGASTISY